jgi:anti-sigma factor RsiW
MAGPDRAITEVDLCAFVDGQLDAARCIEVEDYLSRNPQAAAAVMADMRSRDAIRLALRNSAPPRADLLALARQLDRRFGVRRLRSLLPRVSFAALALICVWLASDEISEAIAPPSRAAAVPAFANEALETHDTARLRQSMHSEAKSPLIDEAAIWNATRINFPAPSADWRVLDARLVPSGQGTGLEISLDSGSSAPLTFFAIRTPDKAPFNPEAVSVGSAAVAYWRRGPVGYALTGRLSPAELDRLAEDLANNPAG